MVLEICGSLYRMIEASWQTQVYMYMMYILMNTNKPIKIMKLHQNYIYLKYQRTNMLTIKITLIPDSKIVILEFKSNN